MMSRTHCCLCAATSVAAARTKSSFIISLRPYVAVPSALGEVGWGGKLSSVVSGMVSGPPKIDMNFPTVNLHRIEVWVCSGQTPRACELISTDCSFGGVGDSVICPQGQISSRS